MKKYFVKETGEEIKIGEFVEVSLHKELEDGSVDCRREIEMTEENVETLVDLGILEEGDQEQEDLLDFADEEDPDDCIDCLCDRMGDLEKWSDAVNLSLKNFADAINRLGQEVFSLKKYGLAIAQGNAEEIAKLKKEVKGGKKITIKEEA